MDLFVDLSHYEYNGKTPYPDDHRRVRVISIRCSPAAPPPTAARIRSGGGTRGGYRSASVGGDPGGSAVASGARIASKRCTARERVYK